MRNVEDQIQGSFIEGRCSDSVEENIRIRYSVYKKIAPDRLKVASIGSQKAVTSDSHPDDNASSKKIGVI